MDISPGQSGFWFAPPDFHPPRDSAFELVVEVEEHKALYYGRYVSRPLPGWEMRMSEWVVLDEEIKNTRCRRIAELEIQVAGRQSLNQIQWRQLYDSGEWAAACLSLECVGFDYRLNHILRMTAAERWMVSKWAGVC
ncbi:hypothetical protein K438DRAFT_1853618 [Mycena galopus ATCC 62051]|nr:hypothetical protein K438DRAFT_1853618 [Mycena galopus ATCC 62051]